MQKSPITISKGLMKSDIEGWVGNILEVYELVPAVWAGEQDTTLKFYLNKDMNGANS